LPSAVVGALERRQDRLAREQAQRKYYDIIDSAPVGIVRADGAHVFRVARGDVAERVPVRLGNGSSDRVEVQGGLAPGDRVIVRGGERLRPGQAVTITTSSASVATKPAPPEG